MNAPVVIDTNIVFAALLAQHSPTRQILLSETQSFVAPRFVFVELFKRQQRILRASELKESDLLELLHTLLLRLRFWDEGLISVGDWIEARRLCHEIDPKDTPFVAPTLHLRGLLWTSDHELRTGLMSRGFNLFFSPPPQ
jgi:predicted nucleic acid-binding protein